jgi:hypothetical protein
VVTEEADVAAAAVAVATEDRAGKG